MKKILCLVMATLMMFSCISAGVTASALDPIVRPEAVANVIDPIRRGESTSFATTIDEIGYASVNSYAKSGMIITKDKFNEFITVNADDKMFGVDFDFLYYKDNGAFIWNSLDRKLEAEVDEELVNGILNGLKDKNGNAVNYNTFVAKWNSLNIARAYTVHDVEMYKAYVSDTTKTTCTKKGAYDACGEVIASYDQYDAKEVDKSTYQSIIETKITVENPFSGTNRKETHYEYSYRFAKGDFGLARANSNNHLAKYVGAAWGDGAIFATPKLASTNAVKLANFIGKLINPQFTELDSNLEPFTDNKKISREKFFEKVTVLSGLDILLESEWCNAKGFDVKDIMTAFGVNVNDDVIFDAELTKGSKMGARILSDIYKGFTSDPMGYVMYVTQLFCKNYELSYKRALTELFSTQFNEILTKSRSGKYPELDYYKGTELSSVDGFYNFITDCIYVMKVDSGDKNASKFRFAPMPVKRYASAADINELYLYMLCYFELNRIYEDNGDIINNKIDKFVESIKGDANTKTILRSMFCGELTFFGLYSLQLGVLTEDLIVNASDNLKSSIKKALAQFLQRFIDAMDNFMNLLFGWTDGLFGGNK